jgi:hypothetical protein
MRGGHRHVTSGHISVEPPPSLACAVCGQGSVRMYGWLPHPLTLPTRMYNVDLNISLLQESRMRIDDATAVFCGIVGALCASCRFLMPTYDLKGVFMLVTTYATGRRHRRQRILENVYTTWCSACGCVWSCGNVIGFNGMWMSHFLPHSRLCLLRWRRLAHCPVTANGNHHAVHSTAPLLAVRSTLISSSVPVTTPSPSSPTASIPALPMPLLHHHHGRG